jgi:hypothetical protein
MPKHRIAIRKPGFFWDFRSARMIGATFGIAILGELFAV